MPETVRVIAEIPKDTYEAICESAKRKRRLDLELALLIIRAAILIDPEEAREQGLARGLMEQIHGRVWLTPIPTGRRRSMIVKERVRTLRAWQNIEGSAKPEWFAELYEPEEDADGTIHFGPRRQTYQQQLGPREFKCRRGEWLIEHQPGAILPMADHIFQYVYEPVE